ncbi:MAG: hypothetical protein QOH83_277 [Solirubrobacteraceae bacterium]|nr:hypothetical protein [Solirubrobacteraceae bacterium]
MQRNQDMCGAFTAAPAVTITPLPFGGAVLVNGRTLALLECAEPDAALLAALVEAPANGRERSGEMAVPLEAAATRLVDDGWLVPAAKDGDVR